MGHFFEQIRKFRLLLLLLILAFLVLLLVSFLTGEGWTGLWVNLSASVLTIVGTLFVVDVVLESRKKEEWEEAESVAKEDIQQLVNMLVSHFSNPFGYKVEPKMLDQKKPLEEQVQVLNQYFLTALQKNLSFLLENALQKNWDSLQINLFILRPRISQTIDLYRDNIPPQLFGKLLAVNRHFGSFFHLFSLFPELFTKEEKYWPPNKLGVGQNRKIRRQFLSLFEKELRKLFKATENISTMLNEWKSKK